MNTEPERRECPALDWYATHESLRAAGFTFFDFLTAVDQTDADEDAGFDVVTHLYAMPPAPTAGRAGESDSAGRVGEKPRESRAETTASTLTSIMVRTRIADGAPLPSITTLWRGAAWHERETHEMFGIEFTGFDDGSRLGVRPLLLPEGFEGNPLRKSFVLAARVSKAWPGAKDPGESDDSPKRKGRRKNLPPGLPDPSWGPR